MADLIFGNFFDVYVFDVYESIPDLQYTNLNMARASLTFTLKFYFSSVFHLNCLQRKSLKWK
jgi:hypothetical protein